jgi:hypothetical protein
MWYTRIFLFLVMLVSGTGLYAAGTEKVFIEKQQWSKLSKGYDYTEKIKEIKPKKASKWKGFGSFSFAGNWLKYVLWILVIAALLVTLAFLILNIYKNTAEKVKDAKVYRSLSIENIEDADLEQFLDESLSAGSFKEAIRIRYLMLIRTLNRLNLVTWKKDKTNGAYVTEMYGKTGFDLFCKLTISFERAWYGEKVIGEAEYQAILPVFDLMNQMVMPNE